MKAEEKQTDTFILGSWIICVILTVQNETQSRGEILSQQKGYLPQTSASGLLTKYVEGT